MPRLHLSQWSGEHIFLESSARETWSPDAGNRQHGAIISRNTDIFKNLDYFLVGKSSLDHWMFSRSLILTVDPLYQQFHNCWIFTSTIVGIAWIYWCKSLQHGVVYLVTVYRPIDGRVDAYHNPYTVSCPSTYLLKSLPKTSWPSVHFWSSSVSASRHLRKYKCLNVDRPMKT